MSGVADQNNDNIIDYVLGFMTARQRRRMERRLKNDAQLLAEIRQMHDCLRPLETLVAPVMPPQEAWRGILDRLNVEAASRHSHWGWAGFGAGLAGVVVFAITIQPRIVYHAQLRDVAGAHLLAQIETNSRNELIVRPRDMPVAPDGKSYELWVIPAGASPLPLGVLPSDHVSKVQSASLQDHAVIAVSLEPTGGSPTGLPTGPVIGSGELHPR